ncbi:unnamed protein product [Zymoseptoria tritici ST99CH_3D7]|uniref:Protein kinase domain-containing protein n=1 Tax=Zymoseptoria tritici (strain ST99CH_3D7) TaxID=1276538 RepID=A0A1X7RNS3_ZYMT9|nr:unnamed protein product [Zymoseptoria tritici ST99CH_3D7]
MLRISRKQSTKTTLIDEETISGYKSTNYYPINVGDTICDDYKIKAKLGYGRDSTVWLCTNKSQSFKTLKVSTAGKAQCRETRVIEHLVDTLATSEHQGKYCVRWPEDIFNIDSADEERHHECFVFEPLGPSLLEFMEGRENKTFHIAEVRWMAIYFLNALDFLHTHEVVHADLKLDNILLTLPSNRSAILNKLVTAEKLSPSFAKITAGGHPVVQSREMNQSDFTFPILCDLGSAVLGRPPHEGLAQGLPYRAPEVILEGHWNEKIDVWSMGVIILELMIDQRLFGDSTEEYALQSMVRWLSSPPVALLDRCTRADQFFDKSGRWKHGEIAHEKLEDRIEIEPEMPQLFDFIRSMLKWDPDERWSASELLKHPWLQN